MIDCPPRPLDTRPGEVDIACSGFADNPETDMRHNLGSLFLASSLGLLTPVSVEQKVDFVKELAPILAKT